MKYEHRVLRYKNGKAEDVNIKELDEVLYSEITKRIKKYYEYNKQPNNLNVLFNIFRYPFCLSLDEVKESYTVFKDIEMCKVRNRYMFVEKNNYLDVYKTLYKLGINPQKLLNDLDFLYIMKDLIIAKFRGIIEPEYIDLRESKDIIYLYLKFSDELEIKINSFNDFNLKELNLDYNVYFFPVLKKDALNKVGKEYESCIQSNSYIYILKKDIYEKNDDKIEETLKKALYINSTEFADYKKIYDDSEIIVYIVEN